MKLKKLLLTFSVVAASACMAFGLAACGEEPVGPGPTPGIDQETCEHQFGSWTTVEEQTCFKDGLRTRTCSICEYVETRSITRKDHELSARQGKEPTCLEGGYTQYSICMNCDTKFDYEELEPLGHHMVTVEGTPPYCTEGGFEDWQRCDRKGCNVNDRADHVLDPLGHVYENGSNVCKRCGEEKYEASEGLAYNLDDVNNWYEVTGIGTCEDVDVVIPETYNGKPVKVIKARAFARDTLLKSVTSRSVTVVGDEAFAYSSIESVKFSKLAEFGSQVFTYCQKLTSFTVPATVRDFGNAIFDGCENLVELKADPASTLYYDEGNCIITKNDNFVVLGIANSEIPDGVKGIAEKAFMRVKMTRVVIPDSVTTIQPWAFGMCSSLREVVIGKNASIGVQAFWNCTSLTKVVIRHSNVELGDEETEGVVSRSIFRDSFMGCRVLSEIEFEGTMEEFKALVGGLEGGLKGTYDPTSLFDTLADYKNYTVECSDGALKEDEAYNSFSFVEAERHEFQAEYIAKILENLDGYARNIKELYEALIADENVKDTAKAIYEKLIVDVEAFIADAENRARVENAETVHDAYTAYSAILDEAQELINEAEAKAE